MNEPIPDRDPDAVLGEQILARWERSFATRPPLAPWKRRARGLQAIAKAQAYLNVCVFEVQTAIAGHDAIGAGHWAMRAAHEAGYIQWVEAKLAGRGYLAPASSRLPNSWTDATRRVGDRS